MLIFDIETGPIADEELRSFCPTFDASSVAGIVTSEFDPASVKLGNTKDAAKVEAKIAEAREAHAAALAESPRLIEAAQRSHFDNFRGRAALSPVTGRVLAIGYLNQVSKVAGIQGVGEKFDEEMLIANFWKKFTECRQQKRPMIGFNIGGFDVPFLVRRSWRLGIDVPDSVFDPSGRYLDRVFVDLMSRWQCGNYRDSIRLADLAAFFGVGGKPDGITGADFARLYFEDRTTAEAYLKNDLMITSGCAARMGFV